ncbi:hypothetical protein OP10G_0393 [Fimbriimonas ginsengisoli Gsoil 348]|uniref:Uncharacterized protein n=1 Tax=Fimbriimonas ginsengisoli Gsoil 348 TaxID=661478 RepID=A0A068NJT0_FIMGI|nr:hypothetical protein OP10G_0393 [Fimbriimonas ginsengisoli Gsoil 348]
MDFEPFRTTDTVNGLTFTLSATSFSVTLFVVPFLAIIEFPAL